MYQISIIIPVAASKSLHLKFKEYVREIIGRGHEVVLIVDQTSDDATNVQTIKVIDELSSSSEPALKIQRGDFGSPGISRNLGKELSSGKWIYFWDADDYPNLDGAFNFVEEVEIFSGDIGIASAELISPDQNSIRLGSSMKELVQWPGLWRMVFEKALIRDISFEKWDWCEDQDFILKSLSRAKRICTSDKCIYQYSLHVPLSSTSKRANWKSIPLFIASIKNRIAMGVCSRLDIFFLMKNIYSLRKYVGLFVWFREMIMALPQILAFTRLKTLAFNKMDN